MVFNSEIEEYALNILATLQAMKRKATVHQIKKPRQSEEGKEKQESTQYPSYCSEREVGFGQTINIMMSPQGDDDDQVITDARRDIRPSSALMTPQKKSSG